MFLECSSYFSLMHLIVLYNVGKFHSPSSNTFWDMNYYPVWFLVKSTRWLEKIFLECSHYFSRVHLTALYNVVKFQSPNYNTFWDMNYYPVWFLVKSRQTTGRQTDKQTDRQTDRQKDRQKATHMSPVCKMHRWAQKMSCHSTTMRIKQLNGAIHQYETRFFNAKRFFFQDISLHLDPYIFNLP